MKIQSSDIQMSGQHQALKNEEVEQKVTSWRGSQRSENTYTLTAEQASLVNISQFAQALQAFQSNQGAQVAAPAAETQAVSGEESEAPLDPKLQVLKGLIERLTGRPIKLAEFSEIHQALQQQSQAQTSATGQGGPAGAARQGWGMEIQSVHRYSEKEEVSFKASGRITTADNKQIDFNLEFSMKREFSVESSETIRMGDAKRVDPLILNFNNQSIAMNPNKIEFDLNADGKKEKINFPVGAGFLALDRNHDGKINDGSELFGPGSGNGFSELARYDSDGNNWIDENDPIFQQLRVWNKDANGKDQLQTLKQANVGALYLGQTATPFSINDTNNANLAQLRSSGVFLSEDGKTHALQQIDLSV